MNIGTHGGSCGHSCCLRIQNLSVKIGKDSILRDVNMHLHCGQIVALIGPNGAGKSTLLKAVLGQREYEGVISFSVPAAVGYYWMIGYVFSIIQTIILSKLMPLPTFTEEEIERRVALIENAKNYTNSPYVLSKEEMREIYRRLFAKKRR